jgi:PAS domain S-box-containing protein
MRRSDAVHGPSDDRLAQRLVLLINQVADYAIFLLDPDGYVASWNRGAERIKGYTAAEIIGRHFSAFYTDEARERDHPGDELAIARREGRYEEEGWRVRKDGSTFWANVVITCLRDADGQVVGFGKVTRDLTARRLAEEQMRADADRLVIANRELEQFRRLVISVRDYAIFMLDPGGHIVTWNAGAEHLKGYTAQEAIGRHFSMFYTAEDRERAHPAYELEVAAREGRYEEEGWRVRKDGSTFWANVLITAVRTEQGVLVGYAKITRDLTERRAAEAALREANEELGRVNRELDRFASVAAHDLREPLRTIAGFAELLATRYRESLDERAAHYVDHITHAVERLDQLVESLLAYARSSDAAAPGRRIALAALVGTLLADLHAAIAERGADLHVEVPDDAAVTAAEQDVAAVLRNLLSNAVKFADPEHPRVAVRAERDGDGWRVDVSDNGIGIEPADRPRIFAPFQRLHSASEHPGTGLGLAIAQRVVERNGGSIGVDSVVGQGSRFWFVLPSADVAGEQSPA